MAIRHWGCEPNFDESFYALDYRQQFKHLYNYLNFFGHYATFESSFQCEFRSHIIIFFLFYLMNDISKHSNNSRGKKYPCFNLKLFILELMLLFLPLGWTNYILLDFYLSALQIGLISFQDKLYKILWFFIFLYLFFFFFSKRKSQ